jgi:hypothetical protein
MGTAADSLTVMEGVRNRNAVAPSATDHFYRFSPTFLGYESRNLAEIDSPIKLKFLFDNLGHCN